MFGGGSDRRTDSADIGGVGNAEQKWDGETPITSTADHRERHREHHQRRRGIRDPHGECRGRDHETEDHAPSTMPSQTSHALDDCNRHLLMRPGAFHGPTQHESTHEEENQTVTVRVGGRLVIKQTKRGKECQRNQTGRRNGYRFGDPPDSAPKRHARQHRIVKLEAAGAEGHGKSHRQNRPERQCDSLHPGTLWCLFLMTQREFSVVKGDGESRVAMAQTVIGKLGSLRRE